MPRYLPPQVRDPKEEAEARRKEEEVRALAEAAAAEERRREVCSLVITPLLTSGPHQGR